MTKKIHVNQWHIKANRKDGGNRPVFTVKTYKSNDYADKVLMMGPAKLVYTPDKPLSCGAVCYIECADNVVLYKDGESKIV